MPGHVLSQKGNKPAGVWFILQGSIQILEPTDKEAIVVNTMRAVSSCGDSQLNLSCKDSSIIRSSESGPMQCFYLENTNYDKLLSSHLGAKLHKRFEFFSREYEVFRKWELIKLRGFSNIVKE